MRDGAMYGGAANHKGCVSFRPKLRLVVVAFISLLLCVKSLSLVTPHGERGHGLTPIGGWSSLFDNLCDSGREAGAHVAGDSCCLANVDTFGAGREPPVAGVVSVFSPRRAPPGRHEEPPGVVAGWASAWSAQSPPVIG